MAVMCPECGRTLNVRADLPAGKRIKCPKCATVFAADKEVDEDRLEDEEEERPRRKRDRNRDDDSDERYRDDDVERRPRRKRAKVRRGSSAALIWGLIGGVGALVLIVIVVVVLILVGGSSAFSRHEEAMKESLQLMAEFENAMNEVKDQNTARVAADKIQRLCDRLEALGNKVKALPKLTQVEDKRLQDKYKPQADGFAQRMQKLGIQAGLNSRGEASFMAAVQRLARIGQSLKQMGI